jgi:hypothetical protein
MATAMYLQSINRRIDQLDGQTQSALPAPNIPRGHIWHKQFRVSFKLSSPSLLNPTDPLRQTFIRNQIREKLLQTDLQSYGRTHTVATHSLIPRTPLLLVKVRSLFIPNQVITDSVVQS